MTIDTVTRSDAPRTATQTLPGEDLKELVLTSGQQHFTSLIQDIDQAQKTIDFEIYLFHRDALGNKILEALSKAAQRGVQVRVMVDGAGSPFFGTTSAKLLERAGVQTKIFHPFPWQLWNWSRSFVKLPSVLKTIYLFFKINSRNHRKVCLIDNKIAYIGSFNVSQCHLEKQIGGEDWRDTSIRLTHTNFKELVTAFDAAWTHRDIRERIHEALQHVRKDPYLRLNFTRHRRRFLYKQLLTKIRLCQKRIWITNAYFVPDNFLLKRLIDAANRGVDVRILLPRKSDVTIMPWASSTFYYALLKSGIRIFEYLPSMLHSKSLIVDNWVLVGSSNLNHRSLLHDLEVDVNVRTETAKSTLSHQFLKDLKNSREISLKDWHILRPRWQRALGRLFLYMKYWI